MNAAAWLPRRRAECAKCVIKAGDDGKYREGKTEFDRAAAKLLL